MKALVLAGGAGTRLRPFSHSLPKQLIPVANKPVLVHVLENIRDLGVTEVGLTVGQQAGPISQALGDGAELGLDLTYLVQDRPRGLAHCVQIARDFLGSEDFLMYLGDNMLPEGIGALADEFRGSTADAHVVVQKVPDPGAFGVAELGADGRVLRLVEKPREPVSDLALIGVYFFTAAVHEAVDAISPSARGELEITDALQRMVAQGRDVRAQVYSGYWKDTGTIEDLLDCNRELLTGLRHEVHGSVDGSSRLIGPVVVGPGARITGSVVTGPVVVGDDAVIDGSEIGPYTSIGAGCRIGSAALDSSIVQAEVTIHGVRGISGSVIGRRSTVEAAPAAHPHLVVGDDSLVRLADK